MSFIICLPYIAIAFLRQIHEQLSSIYLQWRLECEEEDIKRIRHIYPPTKMKSMRLQCEVFELLNKEWNINNSKVIFVKKLSMHMQ